MIVLIFTSFFFSFSGWGDSPLGTSATVGLLYQPRMIDDDDYGAVGGMRIGKGNRSTRRKPAPVPLCTPQIPHDLGSNPGRRGGKPATNRLSYGTARFLPIVTDYKVSLHKLIHGLLASHKPLHRCLCNPVLCIIVILKYVSKMYKFVTMVY
jgi:hypothetical protein